MDTLPFFQEFNYKNLKLANRFVMAPMTRNQSPNGVPTQQVADYYARRASAGVGLILSEGTVINRPASKNLPQIPNFHGTEALSGWKNVIDAVHKHGGKMGPQIWHVGNTPYAGDDWSPSGPWEGPKTMSLADIESAINGYAQSALDAKNLGFDVVELHGAHGYLIDQFFWDETNQRTDEYGGKTLVERSRFAIDVVKAVRKAVGDDLTVILRLSQWKASAYDFKLAPNPAQMEAWLQPLVDAGVDIFHCSTRRFWEPEFEGSDLNFAGWAKKITGQPTITVGSVGLAGDFMSAFAGEGSEKSDLSELLRGFERGDFDLIAVGRALLADPLWVQKVKEGKLEELHDFSVDSLSRLY